MIFKGLENNLNQLSSFKKEILILLRQSIFFLFFFMIVHFAFGQLISIKGIGLVAPPRAYKTDPSIPLCNINANWVAVHPYSYTKRGVPQVNYENWSSQWWGERKVGVEATIRLAKERGLK